jgi:hypothetical protein
MTVLFKFSALRNWPYEHDNKRISNGLPPRYTISKDYTHCAQHGYPLKFRTIIYPVGFMWRLARMFHPLFDLVTLAAKFNRDKCVRNKTPRQYSAELSWFKFGCYLEEECLSGVGTGGQAWRSSNTPPSEAMSPPLNSACTF